MRSFIIVGFTFYITLCYDLGYNIALWPHYKYLLLSLVIILIDLMNYFRII